MEPRWIRSVLAVVLSAVIAVWVAFAWENSRGGRPPDRAEIREGVLTIEQPEKIA